MCYIMFSMCQAYYVIISILSTTCFRNYVMICNCSNWLIFFS